MTDTPRTEAGRRLLAHIPYDYPPLRDAILAIEAEAAAGPRDLAERIEALSLFDPDARTMADAAESMRERAVALADEAAAGPRDVPVLPPPDMSLIDTLGEGADPNRPVRIKR